MVLVMIPTPSSINFSNQDSDRGGVHPQDVQQEPDQSHSAERGGEGSAEALQMTNSSKEQAGELADPLREQTNQQAGSSAVGSSYAVNHTVQQFHPLDLSSTVRVGQLAVNQSGHQTNQPGSSTYQLNQPINSSHHTRQPGNSSHQTNQSGIRTPQLNQPISITHQSNQPGNSNPPNGNITREINQPPSGLLGQQIHPPGGSCEEPVNWPPPTPLSSGCEDHWSWNKNDKSHEVRLYGPKQRIAHFHPNWSNGTAGVRGTRILNGGRFYWEINVSQRIFGTSMMFGIGTKKARLHVDAFVNMLGEDEASWGLSHKGLLWHGGQHRQYAKCFRENIATTIGLYFDGVGGTLSYYKDKVFLGVAFSGLQEVREPLYPVVCSTAAKTEMSLGVLKRDFVNLQDRCRATVLKQLTREEQIDQLRLPLRIKQYISEGLENFQEDVALSMNNQMTHW